LTIYPLIRSFEFTHTFLTKSQKYFFPPLHIQSQFTRITENVEALCEKQRASGKEIEGLFEGLMQRACRREMSMGKTCCEYYSGFQMKTNKDSLWRVETTTILIYEIDR